MNLKELKIYASLAALFAARKDNEQSTRPAKRHPSEVAHLSKQERRKRRRIHRLSTRKR
jgi:hypothetical protein